LAVECRLPQHPIESFVSCGLLTPHQIVRLVPFAGRAHLNTRSNHSHLVINWPRSPQLLIASFAFLLAALRQQTLEFHGRPQLTPVHSTARLF
jgi:hypothetical protein